MKLLVSFFLLLSSVAFANQFSKDAFLCTSDNIAVLRGSLTKKAITRGDEHKSNLLGIINSGRGYDCEVFYPNFALPGSYNEHAFKFIVKGTRATYVVVDQWSRRDPTRNTVSIVRR